MVWCGVVWCGVVWCVACRVCSSIFLSFSLSPCDLVCVSVCVSVCVVCAVRCGTLKTPVCRLKTPPCVHSKRPVYAGNTRTCFSTCARGAGTHGEVLNVHTESVLSLHTGVIASSAYQEKPTQS